MPRFLTLALLASSALAAEFTPLTPADRAHPGADLAPAADPRTYADEEGLAARRALIIAGLRGEDLAKWRRGYFAGGDPGKYLPGAAMAKLLADPNDAMARQYLNDNRSFKEHYHFAAINWARVLPLFGAAITDDTQAKVAQEAARYGAYLTGGGTENHKVMWYTSALVLCDYLVGDGPVGQQPRAAAKERQIAWLRSYGKRLYAVGQGEWDSSTYLAFDLNGLLNVYDFSRDEQARLYAKAILDLLVAGYAVKYTDGVYCAPNQRGWAAGPMRSITDQIGWVWWDSTKPMTAEDCANFRYSLHAATSSYRPNALITALAQRTIGGLPADYANTKPNYWFGQNVTPRAGVYPEHVHVDRRYTLGALLRGNGGQMTRWQLAVPHTDTVHVLTGGSTAGRNDGNGLMQGDKYQDGNGLFDRTVTVGSTLVNFARLPAGVDAEALAVADADRAKTKPEERGAFIAAQVAKIPDFSYVLLPSGVADPIATADGWWVLNLGEVFVGIRPLGGPATLADVDQGKRGTLRILRIDGRETGFVLEVATVDEVADVSAFKAALSAMTVEGDGRAVRLVRRDGRALLAAWGDEQGAASLDGEAIPLPSAVYAGPHLQLAESVLTLRDGDTGYTIDWSGEDPVYGPLR